MRLKCLACEALARPVYLAAAHSPHSVDVTLFHMGLHNEPVKLRQRLQEEIDLASASPVDAIVLAYALCGKATAGLQAASVPLVIPKAHDCITLFLGSRAAYNQEQAACPGTYWYSQDYIERMDPNGTPLALGSGFGDEDQIKATYESYVKKYGQDNADYLMEVMGAWQSHYSRAVYLDTGLNEDVQVEQRAREQAARRGWAFERKAADLVLIHKLISGEWDADILQVQPGQKIGMSFDDEIIKAE